MFSYAVVLWQLITRDEPFSGKSQVEAAAAVALDGKRNDFPTLTPSKVKDLISLSWDADPGQRPSFDAITASLIEISRSLSSEEKKWLNASLGHHLYPAKKGKVDKRQVPEPPNLAHLQQAKKKGLRSLFNRKSVYF